MMETNLNVNLKNFVCFIPVIKQKQQRKKNLQVVPSTSYFLHFEKHWKAITHNTNKLSYEDVLNLASYFFKIGEIRYTFQRNYSSVGKYCSMAFNALNKMFFFSSIGQAVEETFHRYFQECNSDRRLSNVIVVTWNDRGS